MDVRLFDFRTYVAEDKSVASGDNKQFNIQMFGIDEQRNTFSIEVTDFKPYFYVKTPENYTKLDKQIFVDHIKSVMGQYFSDSLLQCALLRKKKLNGFDGCSDHNFLCFKFRGMSSFYKARNLWYTEDKKDKSKKILKPGGYFFKGHIYKIYEADIPPLLRFLHIKDISPSGWIRVTPTQHTCEHDTTCTYSFSVTCKDIESLPQKETIVPFKICSFDIEADSYDGDFPRAIKDYKKLSESISELARKKRLNQSDLTHLILAAFQYELNHDITPVRPKKRISKEELIHRIESNLTKKIELPVQVEVEKEVVEPVEPIEPEHEDDEEEEEEELQEDTIMGVLATEKPSSTMICLWLNEYFPKLEGDKVTFIGSTIISYGQEDISLNHCIVLGGCDPVDNVEIETYDTEKEVLLAWTQFIQREDPDIIIGYNTFGFDYQFMFKRSIETGCVDDFLLLSRNKEMMTAKFVDDKIEIEKKTVVLASGEYNLEYIKIPGRIQFDLHNIFRRDYSFDSYKLDSVSSFFIGDKVSRIERGDTSTAIYTKNMQGLEVYNYVVFEEISHSSEYYRNGQKFNVIRVEKDHFVVSSVISPDMTKQVKWGLAKDDVDHHDIFRLTAGSNADRAIVAKYCIQDCRLVSHLFKKTDMLSGFIEMASICSVPIDFLTERGQGIKLQSYMAKQCRKRNMLMPVLQTPDFDSGYEGAAVLKPECGVYIDENIAVNDFNSLYPSCMISEGLSSDSKVWAKEYDLDGNLIKQEGECLNEVFIYDNLPNYTYIDVEYDIYTYRRLTPKGRAIRMVSGKRIVRWAQFPVGKAIMPSILEELLKARSDTRKKMATESNPFLRKMLDNRQLAYKVTANSLYGQTGAKTSKFYDKDVAACCTAVGRMLIMFSKNVIETVYDHRDCMTSLGMVNVTAKCIYGDTDSVFVKYTIIKDGVRIAGKQALGATIELSTEAGDLITQCLKPPHKLAFEKVLMPFILLSKKRYVGMLYEDDSDKCYRKSMGIVLKRRDNARIVKYVYGGLIDILMNRGTTDEAVSFVKLQMKRLVNKQILMSDLIVTKSIRSGYKNPLQIAHKVLADRIGVRDPGNKPKSGDRVQYVYIDIPRKKGQLQGDRIETPEFIEKNKLPIDYSFYITNQLMKPIAQVFELVLENIQGFNRDTYERDLSKWKDLPEEKYLKKVESIRLKEVSRLIFDEFI
jgi:DNA polymerase elongation subunit (family B)